MRRAITLSPFLALLLAGCAQYFGPIGGATANLRFVSLPGNKTEIHELSDAHCIGSLGPMIAVVGHTVSNGPGQGRSLGMPLQETVPRPIASEVRISASQPFAAQMSAVKGPGPTGTPGFHPACTKSFVLRAKEGDDYEVQLEQYLGGCVLNVFRITREKDGSYVRRLANNAHELKKHCN
jgi:hypothetical protein